MLDDDSLIAPLCLDDGSPKRSEGRRNRVSIASDTSTGKKRSNYLDVKCSVITAGKPAILLKKNCRQTSKKWAERKAIRAHKGVVAPLGWEKMISNGLGKDQKVVDRLARLYEEAGEDDDLYGLYSVASHFPERVTATVRERGIRLNTIYREPRNRKARRAGANIDTSRIRRVNETEFAEREAQVGTDCNLIDLDTVKWVE
jgi:hypothetical protein